MDGMEYIRESWLDTLALTTDWLRTEGKEFTMAEHTDFYVGFFTTWHESDKKYKQYRNPLKKGDTVRIVGDVCQGLIGELKVIDHGQEDECFFGIELDAIEGWIFFAADEIETVCPSCRKPFPDGRRCGSQCVCYACYVSQSD
jgi:preprotein translocase subunit YajC